MFEKLNQEELIQLTSVQEGPCVSLYLPKLKPETLSVEYENLLRQAQHLLSFDQRVLLKEQILKKLTDFKPEIHFNSRTKGLALFVNKHWSSFFDSETSFQSKLIVADSFHLRPILDEIQNLHKFNILGLALQEGLFLQSDSGKITDTHNFLLHQSTHSSSFHWKHQNESENVQLPHLQSQTRARGFVDNKFKKKSLQLFFKFIEAKISKTQEYRKRPLIVFTSEPVFNVFKSISSQTNLHFRKIEIGKGLPRGEFMLDQSMIELRKLSAEKQKSISLGAQEVKRVQPIIDDLTKISKAALRGEIRTLFLQDDIEIWGRFHRQSGEIIFHEKQRDSRDDDILDDIACEVIRKGGEVIVLPQNQMPSPSPAAAILSA